MVRSQRGDNCEGSSCKEYSRIPPWYLLRWWNKQVNLISGHDVTAFMPRGAETGAAGTIDIEKQFATMAKVLLLVIGRDNTSVGGKARVELRAAFQDGVDMVTSHGEANHQAI